jgi:hypothetical protein
MLLDNVEVLRLASQYALLNGCRITDDMTFLGKQFIEKLIGFVGIGQYKLLNLRQFVMI